MSELVVHNLGQMGYAAALERQWSLVGQVQQSRSDTVHLVVVEHVPAAITLGRRGKASDILITRDALEQRGIEVHPSTRGGQATYHGPGQLVGYVISHLGVRGKSIRTHVDRLAETVIATARECGSDCCMRDGQQYTGVWTEGQPHRKLAAIGVAVSRWVTYHGLAMNVNTDLDAFGLIVPCGLTDPVTSLSAETNRPLTVSDITDTFINAFEKVYM